MNNFIKNSGIVFVLLGVLCLVAYKYALTSNMLLVASLVLEVAGIGLHIGLNRKLE